MLSLCNEVDHGRLKNLCLRCHAGLRLLSDAELDAVVATIEAEKAAAEAARRGPSTS